MKANTFTCPWLTCTWRPRMSTTSGAGKKWDLALPPDSGLSNCVYCFLQRRPNTTESASRDGERPRVAPLPTGYGTLEGTPCDVGWWRRMEAMYGRDLAAEARTVEADHDFVGFFGAGNRFSYGLLEDADDAELLAVL